MIGALVAGITGSGGGSLSSYESIATATGTGSSATITFSSIPSGFKHLQIRSLNSVDNNAAVLNNMQIRFNSDSGNNYAWHHLYGYNGTPNTYSLATTSSALTFTSINTYSYYYNSVHIIDILDFNNTSKNKTVRVFYGADYNGLYPGWVGHSSGLWMNTNAITSISLVGNFNWTTQSTFALYGIKEA